MPDLALIPAGPLRELADRLDAVADTAGPAGMSVEAQMARSGSYRRAASAVRHAVDTATGARKVAEDENERLRVELEALRIEADGLRADLMEARR